MDARRPISPCLCSAGLKKIIWTSHNWFTLLFSCIKSDNRRKVSSQLPDMYAISPSSRSIKYALSPSCRSIKYAIFPSRRGIIYAISPSSTNIKYAISPSGRSITHAISPTRIYVQSSPKTFVQKKWNLKSSIAHCLLFAVKSKELYTKYYFIVICSWSVNSSSPCYHMQLYKYLIFQNYHILWMS